MNRSIVFLLLVFALVPVYDAGGGLAEPVEKGGPPSRPVVIAYPDSGINPYHMDFREPNWTAHPSTFIPGYPTDAEPLHLTLEANSYPEALAADEELWASIDEEKLYYIPGTRIVAAYTFGTPSEMILDETGHGTMVASSGSGKYEGAAPESAIAVITGAGPGTEALWAYEHPWIDILSDSHVCLAPMVGTAGSWHVPFNVLGWEPYWPSFAEGSYLMTQQERLVVSAGGNAGEGYTSMCGNQAPWNMVIGGSNGDNTTQYPYSSKLYYGRPVEVLGRERFQAAAHDSITGRIDGGGTSSAAPYIAGHAANLIAHARAVLDHQGGFDYEIGAFARAGPDAQIPGAGPLTDGVLNASEVADIIRLSSKQIPTTLRTSALDWNLEQAGLDPIGHYYAPEEVKYIDQGYGAFLPEHYPNTVKLLMGEKPFPTRPWDDYWHEFFKGVAWEYWKPHLCRMMNGIMSMDECVDPALYDLAGPIHDAVAPPL